MATENEIMDKTMNRLLISSYKTGYIFYPCLLLIISNPFSTALRNIFSIFLFLGIIFFSLSNKLFSSSKYAFPKFNKISRSPLFFFFIVIIFFIVSGLVSGQNKSILKVFKILILPSLFTLSCTLVFLKYRKSKIKGLSILFFPVLTASVLSWIGFVYNIKKLGFFENKNLISGLFFLMIIISINSLIKTTEQKKTGQKFKKSAIFGVLITLVNLIAIIHLKTTSVIITLVLFLTILLYDKKKSLCKLLIFCSIFLFLLPCVQNKLTALYKKKTSTFRILTWEYTIKKSLVHPLIGWGPGSSKKVLSHISWPRAAILAEKPEHTHNIFLTILLETGFLGLFSFLCFLLCLFVKLNKSGKINLVLILFNNLFTNFFVDSAYACAAVSFVTVSNFIFLDKKEKIYNEPAQK